MPEPIYDESTIKSLDWKEHIRTRPGMYIGKLGNGKNPDDGIYVLIKEIVDNCIDEYVMGFGKKIEIDIDENRVSIRDYGRGIPLGKVTSGKEFAIRKYFKSVYKQEFQIKVNN